MTKKYKNMKRWFCLSAFFTLLIFIAASCGGPSPANNAGNANNANGNLASGSPIKPPDQPTLNDAPTLNPVVQQYYEALKNKDDAKLRETMTAEFQKSIDDDMKAEKRKDFAAFVAETDYRPGQAIETRNEKIEGDKGQAEIRGGPYKNWTAFEFAKENGKWKFTGRSPAIENVKSQANSNSPH
jgi:hypothetical protein